MLNYHMHYWQNETWDEHRARGDEGKPLDNVVSNQFAKAGIKPGHVLYEVTVKSGELYILCRVLVASVQSREVRPDGERNPHGEDVAFADTAASSPQRFDNQVPGSVTAQLRFISTPDDAENALQYVPGKLNPMRLRRVRHLTPESAALLDNVIDHNEAKLTQRTASQQTSRVWILQYVPGPAGDGYNLDRHVETYGTCDFWESTRASNLIQVGDRAYILRGKGPEPSGIVAVGRIVSPVYNAGNGKKRVDVYFEARVDPPLTRPEMSQDSVLGQSYALTHGIPGADFKIGVEEAVRLERLVKDRLQPFPLDKQFISPDLSLDTRTRSLLAVVQRQGQPEFRRQLIAAYGGKCTVTGCDAVDALEAAHIQPYLGPHTNHVTNGLLLRADIHTLFDLGLVTIDTASMTVRLHPNLAATTYADLAGAKLRSPAHPSLWPNVEGLDDHRRKAGW